jgi:drug/metabolite transporter (DMT)-like permease
MSADPIADAPTTSRFALIYPYLLLSLCMLLWSGNWIVGRALRDTMPPVSLAFWRWTVAGLILAPIALPRLRGKGALLRRSWPLMLGLAATGGAFYHVAAYFGLRHTETINAALLNSATPLFILLASWFFDGRRATARQLIGMVISIVGVLVILNRGDLSRMAALQFSIGDLAILGVMPSWAFYTVMAKRRPIEIDNMTLIFILAVFGVTALAPFYWLESVYVQPTPFNGTTIMAALYMGGCASVGGYWCWNKGAELIGANRAGFTTYLMPAFTTILAMFILDEEVHLFHAVGIVTILFGIWLATSNYNFGRVRRI